MASDGLQKSADQISFGCPPIASSSQWRAIAKRVAPGRCWWGSVARGGTLDEASAQGAVSAGAPFSRSFPTLHGVHRSNRRFSPAGQVSALALWWEVSCRRSSGDRHPPTTREGTSIFTFRMARCQ